MDSKQAVYNVQPQDPSKLNIKSRLLHQPPLNELISVLKEGLTANFADATVELDEYGEGNHFCLGEGLHGNPILLDIGGPPYLLPTVQREKYYDIETILRHIKYDTDARVIGAGAGPWPTTYSNCELIMNVDVSPKYGVGNKTYYALVSKRNEECVVERVLPNEHETTFALLANLYVSEGKPGRVIKVHAKKRTGNLDFISCMQKALENHYKDQLVGLGGTFIMKNGKVKQHVMPDFSETPLTTEAQLNNWLHFYEMETPLTAVGTFVSAETDLDLRVQHFHSINEDKGIGGHYHIDTTPDTIEYEGYFNVAGTLYRVDQPPNKMQFGKD